MNGNFKVIEPYPTPEGYRGPYQEIAMYVRQLLQCEYAMVAVPGKDSIRIQGFAGPNGEKDENPLMLIRGHIRFINESLPADAPLRSNFEAIDRASRRIEEITKRMLDFSKKRVRRTEPCDIGNLISDALRFAQPYIRTRFID